MMADNHYNPVPLHGFKVGDEVIYIFVDGTVQSGVVTGFIGPRVIQIKPDVPATFRSFANIPYNFVFPAYTVRGDSQ
jgi:hypothetical protein